MDPARAVALAEELLAEHGLTGWRVVLTRARRQAGVCRYRSREIGLSAPITRLNDEAEVRDTILHEIAHALVGPQHGHDAVWRARAIAIGCSGERCATGPTVPGAWVGVCPAGHRTERHRRPTRVVTCSRCSPSFDLRAVFEWTYHGRPAPMHPNYVAELAALRGQGPVPGSLRIGQPVRITVPGNPLDGARGVVTKRARTTYHVRVGRRSYRVHFAGVEPLSVSR
ncbi:MAG TPA: SprT-like domain-containing protein [Ornithinicoccus sp.]|nr:SprT-like domain-containing protein [Ornithinicoccus sp.]